MYKNYKSILIIIILLLYPIHSISAYRKTCKIYQNYDSAYTAWDYDRFNHPRKCTNGNNLAPGAVPTDVQDIPTGLNTTNFLSVGNVWLGQNPAINNCTYTNRDDTYYIYAKTSAIWQTVLNTRDDDGDGIANGMDPNPDHLGTFKILQTQSCDPARPSHPPWCWILILTADGRLIEYGTYNDNVDHYKIIHIGNAYITDDNLASMGFAEYVDGAVADGSDQDGIGVGYKPDQGTNPMMSGNDNTGNTSENDYLADIVENSRRQLENQKTQGDYLNDIRNSINEQNKILAEIAEKDTEVNVTVEGSEGPTAGEIGQAVNDGINTRRDQEEAETVAQMNQTIGEINAHDPQFDPNLEAGDIPEEESITGSIGSFFTNNPVSDYINNTRLQMNSPVCSMSTEIWGQPIVLTMCDMEPSLNTFGDVMLAMSGLLAIMIVFRRS